MNVKEWEEHIHKKQDMCSHNYPVRKGKIMKKKIWRQAMWCSNCGLLLDYAPQYNDD